VGLPAQSESWKQSTHWPVAGLQSWLKTEQSNPPSPTQPGKPLDPLELPLLVPVALLLPVPLEPELLAPELACVVPLEEELSTPELPDELPLVELAAPVVELLLPALPVFLVTVPLPQATRPRTPTAAIASAARLQSSNLVMGYPRFDLYQAGRRLVNSTARARVPLRAAGPYWMA
jgi:hypothetical protein